MAYDIPSISDLEAIQLLNKHYAEVITSKEGGVSSAADITQTTNPITGVTRRTLYKILDDMDDTFLERLLKMAFTPVGTFTAGATLTDARQTLLWEVSEGGDGHEYGWAGTFPKVVAAGSTPATSGGIGAGAWVDRTDVTLRSDLASESGSGLVGYQPAGTGAVATTVQSKLREMVSIKDFGAVGDGVTDDTAAIQEALNTARHVTVPVGMTPLISESITVPSQTKLEFFGGIGNLPDALPASYFIKKSTMTTTGIIVAQRGMVVGGGIIGQVGNTGDGIALAGNGAILRDFYACKAGKDGVRVGTDGVFSNCNSTFLNNVRSTDNGRYGIYIHDGVSVGPADANAGSLVDCIAVRNGADGIRLGHCFWVTVTNCVCEANTGHGLYLSGTNNANYPECRYATIIGGDYNEGNSGTVNVNQVYDGSYFSTFLQADGFSVASTAITGMPGGGRRNAIGRASNVLQGLRIEAGASGVDSLPLVVTNDQTGGSTFPVVVQQKTYGANATGPGIRFRIDPNTGTFVNAGGVQCFQFAPGKYGLRFSGYSGGATVDAVDINLNAMALMPITDNTLGLGQPSGRWNVVYAVSGTINTSDQREKQQVRELSDAERAVAVSLKSLVRAFKWNDAVEKKGDDARIHIGVMAQEVKAAFEAKGLDAHKYGMLCYDEWEDEFEPEYETKITQDKDGSSVETQVPTGNQKLVRVAGNRYGVRYDELIAFIIAAL